MTHIDTNITRRDLLAAAALPTLATIPAVVAVSVAMADLPDPVFALAQERDAVMREYGIPDLDDTVMDGLEARLSSVESRIAATQCSTSAAIAEKLRIVLGADAFCDRSAERIVRSALDDLLQMAKDVA